MQYKTISPKTGFIYMHNILKDILYMQCRKQKKRKNRLTNLLVKECIEEMAFQKPFGLPFCPLLQQFNIQIDDLQG